MILLHTLMLILIEYWVTTRYTLSSISMTGIPVTNYQEILDVIGSWPNSDCNPYYYRGLKKDFSVIPSIAYPDTSQRLQAEADFKSYEERTITAFRNHLRDGFRIDTYELSDWNLWFLARHFGLKSRLTDFTKDFTIAFQFATQMSGDSACRIYCLNSAGIMHRLQNELGDPFSFNELCLIQPSLQYRETMEKIGVSRMFIQSGKFLHQSIKTVQTSLLEQIKPEHWKVLEIQAKYFAVIRMELQSTFGIDFTKPLAVSHVIDGICNHINQSHLWH